jgi:hypothetical protein
MADSAIVITWGTPLVGREAMSLNLFMEVIQFWEGKKAQGAVSDFRSYLAGNGAISAQGGFMLIEGDRTKLDALQDSDDFRNHLVKAIHMLSGVEVRSYDTGAAIGKNVERVLGIRKQLGIG